MTKRRISPMHERTRQLVLYLPIVLPNLLDLALQLLDRLLRLGDLDRDPILALDKLGRERGRRGREGIVVRRSSPRMGWEPVWIGEDGLREEGEGVGPAVLIDVQKT
jgi:hypothetical protein